MHLSYGVCRLRARVHLKTLSSLLLIPTEIFRISGIMVSTLSLPKPRKEVEKMVGHIFRGPLLRGKGNNGGFSVLPTVLTCYQ